MILNPQDAYIMRGHPVDRIISSLIPLIINGRTKRLAGSNGSVQAIVDVNETSVPAFNLPIKVLDARGNATYCIDLRKTSTREYRLNEMTSDEYTPNLLTEANFLTNLALAMKAWQTGVAEFSGVYFHATRIYGTWIANRLSKTLVLDIRDRVELSIQFAYYFITSSFKTAALTDNEYNMIVNRLAMYFGYTVPEVYTILDQFQKRVFGNIDEFVKVIAANSQNPKLNKLNYLLLATSLMGSWFGGPNVKELIGVTIEYPPAFMMLVYRGLNERTFKDTEITQLSLKLLRSQHQKDYTNVIADILNRHAKN